MSSADNKRKKLCCNKAIKHDEKTIDCSGYCQKTFHAHCAQVDEELCDAIGANKALYFRCEECRANGTVNDLFRHVISYIDVMREENRNFYSDVINRITKIDTSMESSESAVMEEIKKIDEEVKKIDPILANVDEKINGSPWVEVGKKKNKKAKKSTIIITPRNNDTERESLRKSLKQKINSDGFEISGMFNAPSNGVAILCENEENCEKLISEIELTMASEVNVTKPKMLRPRLKILRLHDADEDNNKLIETLKNKNPCIANAELKVVKREEVKIKGRRDENACNLIIEVNAEVHKEIMKTKKLRHVWEIVRVVDNIHVRRCYQCLGYNHNSSDCLNEIACGKCAGKHKSDVCTSSTEKCINCIRANERMKRTGHTKFSLDVNHNAWSHKCESFKRKVEHCKLAVNTLD